MYAKYKSKTKIEPLVFPFEFEEDQILKDEEIQENGLVKVTDTEVTVKHKYTSEFDFDDKAVAKLEELGYKKYVQKSPKISSVKTLTLQYELKDDVIYGSYVEGKEVDPDRLARYQNSIRARRESECFPIINRGELWYNNLTDMQKAELAEWYAAWLNAPETLKIPTRPEWLK